MALALLGMLFFGFVLGPIALMRGRQVTLALIDTPHEAGLGTANAAMAIGKAGFVLHLAIASTVIPWLLFMLPFLRGG